MRIARWQAIDARRNGPGRLLLGEAILNTGGGAGLTVELRILAQGDADAAALQVLRLTNGALSLCTRQGLRYLGG